MSKALEYPNSTDHWQVRETFENDRQEGNTEGDKKRLHRLYIKFPLINH